MLNNAPPDDWRYGDLPKIRYDLFLEILEIVGEGDIIWLTQTSYKGWDGEYYFRGQYFISPKGFLNLHSA